MDEIGDAPASQEMVEQASSLLQRTGEKPVPPRARLPILVVKIQ